MRALCAGRLGARRRALVRGGAARRDLVHAPGERRGAAPRAGGAQLRAHRCAPRGAPPADRRARANEHHRAHHAALLGHRATGAGRAARLRGGSTRGRRGGPHPARAPHQPPRPERGGGAPPLRRRDRWRAGHDREPEARALRPLPARRSAGHARARLEPARLRAAARRPPRWQASSAGDGDRGDRGRRAPRARRADLSPRAGTRGVRRRRAGHPQPARPGRARGGAGGAGPARRRPSSPWPFR